MTHDSEGRPWARLSETKPGDYLEADASFTCMKPGIHMVWLNDNGLCLVCDEGWHTLRGQAHDDALIGLYKP